MLCEKGVLFSFNCSNNLKKHKGEPCAVVALYFVVTNNIHKKEDPVVQFSLCLCQRTHSAGSFINYHQIFNLFGVPLYIFFCYDENALDQNWITLGMALPLFNSFSQKGISF